jgi:Transcription factor WhiB
MAASRRDRILAYLAEHPGTASAELSRALGSRGSLTWLLGDMAAKEQITATSEWRPALGRNVSLWRVPAPQGTEPPLSYIYARPTPAALRSQGPACRGADPALFFPAPGDDGAEALAICARCPVRSECYARARANREPGGIWGGVNFDPATINQEAQAS